MGAGNDGVAMGFLTSQDREVGEKTRIGRAQKSTDMDSDPSGSGAGARAAAPAIERVQQTQATVILESR